MAANKNEGNYPHFLFFNIRGDGNPGLAALGEPRSTSVERVPKF